MSRDLSAELAEAESVVNRLRLEIKQGPCRQYGHTWKHVGGCNAGCELDKDCSCSVPVHECTKCGDCDYGENEEADRIRAKCAESAA